MRLIGIKYYLLFVIMMTSVCGWSQAGINEAQLKEGNGYFDKGMYLEALKVYRQLLSISPEDAMLNYKYGACLIYSDEETEEPLKYLKYGASKLDDPLAQYFLGKAFHLNYQFADAQEAYNKFIDQADDKLKKRYSDGPQLLKMTENGQSLLSEIKDIVVLDKTEASTKEFFRSYNTEDLGGKIIVTPDDILSKKDKESGENALIFFQSNSSEIYYSSYGSGDQRDIYKVTRLDNGKYTKPVKLSTGVNSNFDENYPFMHPDGQTLYFSSKGHNSMGGYDIFKSVLDPNTGKFGPAVNLDFAISSPDDDIFYIADLNKQYAYFASGRSSELGRLNVYHVKVKAGKANISVIKGNYIATDGSEPITIRVEDALTNKEIGTFNSDPESGEYLLNLPKGGKYKFYVEEDGTNTIHSGIFEVPRGKGTVAYAQEMTFTKVNGVDQLVLNNLFDQPLEEDVSDLIAASLRNKAALDINKDEFVEEEEEIDMSEAYEKAGFARNLSNEEIKAQAEAGGKKFAESSTVDIEDAKMLFAFAQKKQQEAKEQLTTSQTAFEAAKTEQDQAKKEEYLLEAAWNKKEANKKNLSADNAIKLLKKLDKSSKNKYERYEDFAENSQKIEKSIAEENFDNLVQAFETHKELTKKEDFPTILELVREESQEKIRQSARALEFAQKIDDEKRELSESLVVKEKQLEQLTKNKEIEAMQTEIATMKEELEDYEVQSKGAYDRYETRVKDQKNTEEQGRMFADYQLNQAGGEWENLEPMAYDKDELTAFDQTLRKHKTAAKKVDIEAVEVSQLLAKRDDLSHRFDFGEVVRDAGDVTVENERISPTVPDDLEFVEENVPEESLVVIDQEVESEDDYQMFLVNTEKKEDPSADWDLKIKKYQELKENATAEDLVVLDQRIQGIEKLKSDRIEAIATAANNAEIMASVRQESIVVADKDLNEEEPEEIANWINPAYENQKQAILESGKTFEEKQADFRSLNSSYAMDIDNAKAELMKVYTVNNIAGTTKAKRNLTFLEQLKTTVTEASLPEEVVAEEVEEPSNEEAPTETVEETVTEVTEPEAVVEEPVNETVDGISTDPAIFFDDSKSLSDIEKQEASTIAKVDGMTQENSLRLKLIEESAADPLTKVQEKLAYNDLYLSALKMKRFSNFQEVNRDASLMEARQQENAAIDKLVEATELEMDKDRAQLSGMVQLDVSARDLDNAKAKDNYLIELNQIQQSEASAEEKIKQQIILENMVALSLEKEIKLNEAKLAQPEISAIEKDYVQEENVKLKKNYQAIRQANSIKVKELNVGVSEEELFERQKQRAYLPDNFFRKADYTELIKKTGYKEVDLYYPEAKAIQEVANKEMVLLASQKREIASIEYRKKELAIGEKLVEANDLEYAEISRLLEGVNYNDLGHVELGQKAESYAAQAKKWNRSVESLQQLSVNAIGDEKNNLLKELVASQMNAIEYARHANAIVNYLGSGKDGDQFVFSDFVVPNDLLAPLQQNTNFALTEDIFQEAYVGYNYLNDEPLLTAEGGASRSTEEVVPDETTEVVPNEVTETPNEVVEEVAETVPDAVVEETPIVEQPAVNEVIEEPTTNPVEEIVEEVIVPEETIVDPVEEVVNEVIEEPLEEVSETVEETPVVEEVVEATVEQPEVFKRDTTKFFRPESLTPEALQGATVRLNQESVKPALPVNDNGVGLTAERQAIVRNITGKTEKGVAVDRKISLIEQIEEMMVDQVNVQQTYAEKLFQKEQGLVVVNQSLDKDGSTDVLVEEYNRLVAEIKQLKNYDAIAKENVLSLDNQLDVEQNRLVVLRRQLEEEETIESFAVEENLYTPEIPRVLEKSIFVRSTDEASAYSAENPIPVDPVMPEGIVYQVQVGAYRQPIPQDLFKGFTPIMGEKIQSGITRYKVGLFTSYNVANVAKSDIRDLGYSDAFVVVFNNGNKISIAEAKRLAGEIQDGLASNGQPGNNGNAGTNGNAGSEGGNGSNGSNSDSSNGTNTQGGVNSGTNGTNGGNNPSGSQTADGTTNDGTNGTGISELDDYTFVEDETKDDYYNDPEAAEAGQVEMIQGLFYTVQIGAYSKPVSADKLLNITPLNTELTKSGIIRYTSGIYKDFNEVDGYKETVRSKGLGDAFVSAYYNGFRITLAKAKELFDQGGAGILVDSSAERKGESENTGTTENTIVEETPNNEAPKSDVYETKDEVLDAANAIIENGLPTDMVWDLLENEGMIEGAEDNTFKVILGPFEQAIPTREVEIILNFRDNIRFEERGENAYVYSSINPIPFTEARKLKKMLEDEGLTTAKVVSFKGNREVTMEEFLKELSE